MGLFKKLRNRPRLSHCRPSALVAGGVIGTL